MQWPQPEYELEVRIMDTVLEDSPALWLDELTLGDLTDGPNPSACCINYLLRLLLTAARFHQIALMAPPSETLGELFCHGASICHILASNGIEGTDLIGQILTDSRC